MTTRLCVKCGVEKSIDQFEPRYDHDGYRNACRKCLNNYRNGHWRAKQKEKYDKQRLFQKQHPGQKECIKCGKIKYLARFNVHKTASDGHRNICKKCQNIYSQNHHKKKKIALRNHNLEKFGLTHDDYLQMFENQDGKCAICQTDDPGKGLKNFNIDHDHNTGKNRALLCRHCNTALGGFKDDPNLLRKAIDYLESFID